MDQSREVLSELETKKTLLPDRPGVYLMKNADNEIIYVGKALSLKSRVRSYFQDAARLAPKVQAMMRHVKDFEIIVTDTEVEALILEATLIKQHQPHYNIRLKDDKSYPYLRLTWEEEFPRLIIARKATEPRSRYFGPYTRAQSVRETIQLLRRIFPIRNCTNQRLRNAVRPCLQYHIKRCDAPCMHWVEADVYRKMMRQVELFLEGKVDTVEKELLQQLQEAAEALQFERAAQLRDQIKAVREMTEQQKVSSEAGRDLDAISWVIADSDAYVQVFIVRSGRLVGRESLTLTNVDQTDDADVARAFLLNYYDRAEKVPPEILVEQMPSDAQTMADWLKVRRGGKVDMKVPQRGEKLHMLSMVRRNAELARDEALRRIAVKERDRGEALLGIQYALGLDKLPRRMECYDISNTQGTESVASMVVFTEGHPDTAQYRRFRIQTVEGPNDFASMREVIRRRFQHQAAADKIPGQGKIFARTPDLVIIDGGRGQLKYAVQAMDEAGVMQIPVFGLAKQHEWLYAPDSSEPIILDRDSPALKVLQQLRDEAHRFAITFHRQLRTQRNLRSVLDDIPEIGPVRKKTLRQEYATLEALHNASVDELSRLPHMNRKAAEAVADYLARWAKEQSNGIKTSSPKKEA
ncbi:MAG: excinuclease ABC subunit UvrC [Firmicutes bacterium]|nr:excinuclease ABC subunit UvrC [Bacillota bacterium]